MKYIFYIFFSSLYLYANSHIFIYHRFGDDRYKSTNTTIEELRKEFEYFKQNGYKVVPLSKITAKLKAKEDIPHNNMQKI